jgi:4-phytase/acid phosphatase
LAEVPNVFSSELRVQLGLLNHVLAPDPAQPAKKSIFGPSARQAGDSSDIIQASKPRAIASEIVEDLLLEYADNKPMSEVGWGRVDEASLLKLMPIRISAFNLEKRTPAFARPARSNLLSHILDTLDQAAIDAPKRGALGPTKTRLVYISGHDSDLAGIGGLLGLHWTADGRTDDTPPDSQIVFELWRNPDTKQDTVRIRYHAQTLAQLRASSSLIGASTPDEVQLVPTGCAAIVGCPWNLFYKAAQERLSSAHVKRKLTPSQIAR